MGIFNFPIFGPGVGDTGSLALMWYNDDGEQQQPATSPTRDHLKDPEYQTKSRSQIPQPPETRASSQLFLII